MVALLAALWIGSTSSVEAPALPPIPPGLPPAIETPCDTCADEPGIWLPLRRAEAIDRQRRQANALQEKCQARLDYQAEVCDARCQSMGRIARKEGELDAALAALEEVDWESRLTWGLGGVVVGVGLTTILVWSFAAGR